MKREIMVQQQIYEGTAEEIADQLRGSNLAGKLKAVVTLEEQEISPTSGPGETLDKALAYLLDEADSIERARPITQTDLHETAFGEIMAAKYRKMGFKT